MWKNVSKLIYSSIDFVDLIIELRRQVALGIKDSRNSVAPLRLEKIKVTNELGAVCWDIPSLRPCPPSVN